MQIKQETDKKDNVPNNIQDSLENTKNVPNQDADQDKMILRKSSTLKESIIKNFSCHAIDMVTSMKEKENMSPQKVGMDFRSSVRKEYNMRMRTTVPNGDSEKNRYQLLREWYQNFYECENTLVIRHIGVDYKEQLDGLVSFLTTYGECKQWFDVLGFWNSKLHWQVKATGVEDYGDLRKRFV